MDRDFETEGALLIKTKFGSVSATRENFNVPLEEMTSNEAWREEVGASGAVFCLPPWERDIPF